MSSGPVVPMVRVHGALQHGVFSWYQMSCSAIIFWRQFLHMHSN